MSKKLWTYSFISLLLFISCAPKPKQGLPPAPYQREDLSLAEIVQKAGGDTEVIKAIARIDIHKNGKPFDTVNALFLARKEGDVHARIYKFGILARDFIIKDGRLYAISGKESKELRNIGIEMYKAVFWWENIEAGILETGRKIYRITTGDTEIRLDRATLLPIDQTVKALNRRIFIRYSKPRESEDGSWNPSEVYIKINNFDINITLKKLIKNPSLSPTDFRIPRQS